MIYGLIDLGFDIIMVDFFFVKLLNIEGILIKFFFMIVNSVDVEERGMKVNFKIVLLDNKNDYVIVVNFVWVVKDFIIFLKYVRLLRFLE